MTKFGDHTRYDKQSSIHGQIWTHSVKLSVLDVDTCVYFNYGTIGTLFNTVLLDISIFVTILR